MLLPRLRVFVAQNSLLTHGQLLAVGVSGGPDSIALLHLLTRLRADYNLKLIAAHLHHGLRPEADRDAEFVLKTASAWGVECVVERADVAALAEAGRLSIEEAGRKARYEFFARLAPTVAVAHNADDQAETVLMHFLRGSGMAGLRGMLPLSRQPASRAVSGQLTIIRPLLAVPRAEIEAYLAAHELEYIVDATNTDTTFFRNRLRHELIPLLETYTPNIREILHRTAEVIGGDYELLHDLVERAWDDVRADSRALRPLHAIAFNLTRWRALPLALQRALLRQSVAHLRPHLRDLDFRPIDHAVRWIQTAESGHTADLLGGLCISIVGGEMRVGQWTEGSREKAEGRGQKADYVLTAPGVTNFLGYTLTAELLDAFSLAEVESNPDPWTAYIDAGLGPFTLRTRRKGDRFQPLGMSGTMKLSDFMINLKIPVDLRDSWPLLCCGSNAETVLWVVGHRLSERARVRQGTKRVVKVACTH